MHAALAHAPESVPFKDLAHCFAHNGRSLGNLYLNLRDEHFRLQPPAQFSGFCALEEQGQRFDKVCACLFNGVALARYVVLGGTWRRTLRLRVR